MIGKKGDEDFMINSKSGILLPQSVFSSNNLRFNSLRGTQY